MRQITAMLAEGNPRAQLAFDIFVHRLRSCIGAMLASLGGLDALVFTAGIGENSPTIRSSAACVLRLNFWGSGSAPKKMPARQLVKILLWRIQPYGFW